MATETIDYVIKVEADAAASGTARLASEMDKVAASADKVSSATKGAAGPVNAVGDAVATTAGKSQSAERIFAQLAQTLGIVSPQAAAAARAASDVAGGFELLSAAGASALSILGPVAIAVGALALVYRGLAKDLKDAEDAQKKQSAATTAAQALAGQASKARVEERIKSGELTGEAATAALAGTGSVSTPAVQLQQAVLAKAQENLASFLQSHPIDTRPILEGVVLSADEAAREAGVAAARQANLVPLQDAVARATDNLSKATTDAAGVIVDGLAAGLKKGATAAKSQAEQNGEKLAALEAESARKAFLETLGVAPSSTLGAGIPAASLGGGFALPSFGGFTLGGLAPGGGLGLGSTLTLPGSFGTQAAGTATSGITPEQLASVANRTARIGASTLQGIANPAGALTALGPAGAAIGGLAAIGTLGPSGVSQQLHGLKDAVIDGLKALPEILSEVIPDFVVALVEELIPALSDSLPDIIKAGLVDLPLAIASELGKILTPHLGAGEGSGGAFGGGFLGLQGNAKQGVQAGEVLRTGIRAGLASFTGGLSEAFIGQFQEGGLIDRTGFALVHRGEQVVPSSGAGSGNATAASGRFQAGRGGASIDMRGALIGQNAGNEILRLLEETIGPGGIGSTTINGLAGVAGI